MIASQVLNQLTSCARAQGQVELFVHAPSPDVCRLVRELASAVPGAWQPVPDEALGMITVSVDVAGCCVVDWNVFLVPQPPGWVAPADDDAQEQAELAAGQALTAIATAEVAAVRRQMFNPAEAN